MSDKWTVTNDFSFQLGHLELFIRLHHMIFNTYRQTTAFLFSPALQNILARAAAKA